MISCPRVIAFEELIIEWSIKLMQKIGKDELFKRRSLEQDQAEMARLGNSADQKLYTILKLNIVTKKIYEGHMKTLKVVRAILGRIKDLELDDEDGYAKATYAFVEDLEESDSEQEIFKRRMGMRKYFNQLKMSLVRIKNAKEAKEEAAKRAKEATANSAIPDEIQPAQAAAAFESELKGSKTAAVTNPPIKASAKKGKAGGAKKKATKKKATKKK